MVGQSFSEFVTLPASSSPAYMELFVEFWWAHLRPPRADPRVPAILNNLDARVLDSNSNPDTNFESTVLE
jgi:hypothetical protein